jgi:hypothetical protein
MSKKAKEKKSKSQLPLDFHPKADKMVANQTKGDFSETSRIVYMDPRKEIYQRILDRKME